MRADPAVPRGAQRLRRSPKGHARTPAVVGWEAAAGSKRGFTGASFICIPPNSAAAYRVITYVIMFMLAGMALKKAGRA